MSQSGLSSLGFFLVFSTPAFFFQSPPSKRRKLEKPRKPITFVVLGSVMKELSLKAEALGAEALEGIVVVTTWIEKILTDLKVPGQAGGSH